MIALVTGLGLFISSSRMRDKRKNLAGLVHPDRQHPCLSMSAMSLANMIKRKEMSVARLVDLYIEQIERVNPLLNAMVSSRFKAAREEARLADEKIQRNEELPGTVVLEPLLGVPITVKENFMMEGMPNTAGVVGRMGTIASSEVGCITTLTPSSDSKLQL